MAQIPAPENCPHCLNRGSATFGKGVCGITQVEKTIYDAPLSWQGQPLPFQPQAHYAEGAVITVSSRLTAHHKGHFEMYACADLSPSQGCFNKHPLAFVEDMLYGAPPDPSYPGRAYVAPNNGQAANGYTTKDTKGMPFKHKWRLPTGVTGNVILQWRYITGNSCNHLGYHSYDWPSPDWWGPPTMADCPAKLSPTGDKGPEQFWNWYGRITHARAASSEWRQALTYHILTLLLHGRPTRRTNSIDVTIGTKPPISTPAPLPIDEAPPPTDKPAKEPVDEPTDEPTDEPSPGGGGGICGGTKIYMQPSTWSQGAWQHFIVETQSLPDDSAGNEVVISVGVSDVAGDYVAGDYSTVDKLDDLELVEVWNAVPGSIKNKAGESLLSFTTKKWQTAFGFQARYKSDIEKATSPAVAKWNADDC